MELDMYYKTWRGILSAGHITTYGLPYTLLNLLKAVRRYMDGVGINLIRLNTEKGGTIFSKSDGVFLDEFNERASYERNLTISDWGWKPEAVYLSPNTIKGLCTGKLLINSALIKANCENPKLAAWLTHPLLNWDKTTDYRPYGSTWVS
jgi:hypothetical protein